MNVHRIPGITIKKQTTKLIISKYKGNNNYNENVKPKLILTLLVPIPDKEKKLT